MISFDTIIKDIHNVLDGGLSPHLEVSTDSTKRIITLAKNVAVHTLEMVDHRPRPPKTPGDRLIRMSELGTPCYRQLLYKWYYPEYGLPPYAEKQHPTLPIKFTYGDLVEELVLFLAQEAGHDVKCRQGEVVCSPSGTDWYAIGHMDAVIDGVVVDVKSAADVSFQKYVREGLTEENDTFGYLWQLDGYATAMRTGHRAFIFANKHDGSMHLIDRRAETLLPVAANIKSIGQIAEEYLGASTKMPDRMPTKMGKYGEQLGTVCSYCNFKYACYGGKVDGYIVSGRPVYVPSNTNEGATFAKTAIKIPKPTAYGPF